MQPRPQQYVTKRGANHTLHIVLSIATCGLWAVTGWPIAAILGRKTRTTVYQPPAGYYPPPGQSYGPPPGAQYPQQQPPTGHWGPPR
ncbi:hypothetical protein [Actinacidiphila sp. ITFR-21]|uniref:hypothetical protein n=1 Tax=Actinacidiphila sp. ITFR-21 TaxID=3075199 RepID=UPI00288B8DB0|nr:hypothetical protein [Streptomyces sp. ITFR-21]WNI15590.1 hypothetical protein RLT57_08645 [Streptomyces sp. ITFR-21]